MKVRPSVSPEHGYGSAAWQYISHVARNRLGLVLAGILPLMGCGTRTDVPSEAHTDSAHVADTATDHHEPNAVVDPDEDAGVEDDAGLEDDSGNDEPVEQGPVVDTTDEGIDLGDFPPTEGMGLTVRSLAASLRSRPRGDNFVVTFVNPVTAGWSVCGTRTLSGELAHNGGTARQQWWDTARGSFSADNCPTLDVAKELPLGFAIDASDTFAAVARMADGPYKPGATVTMREHLRRNFLIAFHETELYRFLEDRYPDLAEQFARLVTNGIPAQETSFGANVTVSRTGARGVMQTQHDAYVDARRNPSWASAFRGRNGHPMRVRFSTLQTNPWQSARVAALEFDNIFRHFRSTWTDPNHPVWTNPEAFLIPAMIGAYNSGPTRITTMLTSRLADADLRALLGSNDREAIMNQGYIMAISKYFLDRTDPSFGRESVAYVPFVYAWDALFEGGVSTSRADAGVANDAAPVEENSRPTAGRVSTNRAREGWAHARLEDIKTQRFVRVPNAPALGASVPFNRVAWTFATRNVSQGNIRVHAWLMANDPLARRFDGGVATDTRLESTVHNLVADRTLVPADPHHLPLLAFDGDNIDQPWRRVIRRDHVAIVERLTEEVNAILQAHGMSPELFVIPMINSTVRSREANSRLRGSSPHSAHLMFTGLDISRRQFVVMHRMRDGSYQRSISSADTEMYFQALIQASVRLAQEGMLFVRYHGPPQHFHIVPRAAHRRR